jgi:hypothetical protein
VEVLEQATTAVEVRDETGPELAQTPAPTEEQIIPNIQCERTTYVPRFPSCEGGLVCVAWRRFGKVKAWTK